MICPLKFNSNTLDEDGNLVGTALGVCQCEIEGCAWWSGKDEKCAILDISSSLDEITIKFALWIK